MLDQHKALPVCQGLSAQMQRCSWFARLERIAHLLQCILFLVPLKVSFALVVQALLECVQVGHTALILQLQSSVHLGAIALNQLWFLHCVLLDFIALILPAYLRVHWVCFVQRAQPSRSYVRLGASVPTLQFSCSVPLECCVWKGRLQLLIVHWEVCVILVQSSALLGACAHPAAARPRALQGVSVWQGHLWLPHALLRRSQHQAAKPSPTAAALLGRLVGW